MCIRDSLEAMRRRYTRERYFEIVDALRAARPDVSITSDLIVGFPGETESDFEDTLDLVERAALVDSFSFKYSPRPGTKAAEMTDEVSPEVAQDRLERLQAKQKVQTLAYHARRVGEQALVFVDGESRRGDGQLSGRDPQHRVVNVDLVPGHGIAPGDALAVDLVEALPHCLIGVPVDPALRVPSRA